MLEKIEIRIYSLKVSIIQNQHSYVQFIVFLQFVLGNPPLLKMLAYVKTLSAQIELAITLSERFSILSLWSERQQQASLQALV